MERLKSEIDKNDKNLPALEFGNNFQSAGFGLFKHFLQVICGVFNNQKLHTAFFKHPVLYKKILCVGHTSERNWPLMESSSLNQSISSKKV